MGMINDLRRPAWPGPLAASLLVFSLLFASAGAAAEVIHKWVDEKGRVHFGDRPPADVETEVQNIGARSRQNTFSGEAAAEVNRALNTLEETRQENNGEGEKNKEEKIEAARRSNEKLKARRAAAEKARQEELREKTGAYGLQKDAGSQQDSTHGEEGAYQK